MNPLPRVPIPMESGTAVPRWRLVPFMPVLRGGWRRGCLFVLLVLVGLVVGQVTSQRLFPITNNAVHDTGRAQGKAVRADVRRLRSPFVLGWLFDQARGAHRAQEGEPPACVVRMDDHAGAGGRAQAGARSERAATQAAEY